MSQESSSNPVLLAQAYEKHMVPALFVPAARVLLDHAQPQSGERVLDIACGTGIVARRAAPLVGVQGKMIGLDINPAMITVARSLEQPEGAAIEWQEGSALALPFPDQSFDLALCQQGLQFFPDRALAMKEMQRVLVPGGRAFVAVQQSIEKIPVYKAVNDLLSSHLGVPAIGQVFSLGDPDLLRQLFIDAGFHEVEVRPVSYIVQFRSIPDYIQGTIMGASAAVPALAQLDADTRAALVRQVSQEIAAIVEDYIQNGALVFPQAVNIGCGRV